MARLKPKHLDAKRGKRRGIMSEESQQPQNTNPLLTITDPTSEIVEDYSGRGLQIRYLRNESNTGMDANILQCFQQARGTYVWVFGDDDLILAGSMEKILRYLEVGTYDIVHLRPIAFRNSPPAEF